MHPLEKIYYRLTAWLVPKSLKEEGWVMLRYAEFLHDATASFDAGKCKGDFETCTDNFCVDARNHRQWLKERYLWITPSQGMFSKITTFIESNSSKLKSGFLKVR